MDRASPSEIEWDGGLMPAQRLPWFKFWIGVTSNAKVRQLDDATFRTWVELLDAAAQQPKRGRFGSAREAALIVRRPAKHVATLTAAGLLDSTPEGLAIHDWDDWQRWRKEDCNDTPTTTEPPTDQHANNSRTTTRSTLEQDTSSYIRRRREKRDIDVDVDRDEKAAAAAGPEGGVGGDFKKLGSFLKRARPLEEMPEEVRLRLLQPVIELNGKTEPA